MSDYILRKVDDNLWRRVKSKAAAQGMSIRELLIALCQRYVKHGL